MEGRNLCLFDSEGFESFCGLESLKCITVLEMRYISENYCNILEQRFTEWAARLKPHDLDLQKVILYKGCIQAKLIEAIGRLRCRLDLCIEGTISFKPSKINWGYIAGLYTEFAWKYRKVFHKCSRTQLVRGGYFSILNNYTEDFKDEYAHALEVLSGKPQYLSLYSTYATALRWNGYRMRMFDQVRLLVALFCKQMHFPRDVMCIIVSNLCGDDWGEVNFMPLDPKWVGQVLEIGSRISEQKRLIANGNRSLQQTEPHYQVMWKSILAKLEIKLKEQESLLSEIRERMTTNKFGLPCLGRSKKRRKLGV